jgi:hypothetical protein
VRRVVALVLGLAVAVAALYLIASRSSRPPIASGPPSAEIDDASRAKLELVLEEAESED